MTQHTAPVAGPDAGIEVSQAMAPDALGWLSRMLLTQRPEGTHLAGQLDQIAGSTGNSPMLAVRKTARSRAEEYIWLLPGQ